MYEPYNSISEQTRKEILNSVKGVVFKVNSGSEVEYKTLSNAISLIEGVKGLEVLWPRETWYRAMFISIPPSGNIKRHSDGFSVDRDCLGEWTKYHIVITSNSGCLSRSWSDISQEINLRQGMVYSFDPIPEHESVNNGDTDRLHLIMDVYD